MPTYSPDDDIYRQRVLQNQRPEDPEFEPTERLYRRYREQDLLNGKPTPLAGFQFYKTDGLSVNRGKYSEAKDVLEPDCCENHLRQGCVVLEFRVQNIPEEIADPDGSGKVFRFRMKHIPVPTCFAHSEIWCNQQGDVNQQYEKPNKTVRNQFVTKLIEHCLDFQRFDPHS